MMTVVPQCQLPQRQLPQPQLPHPPVPYECVKIASSQVLRYCANGGRPIRTMVQSTQEPLPHARISISCGWKGRIHARLATGRHVTASRADDCTTDEIKGSAIESAMLWKSDIAQRARGPRRRRVAPYIPTSSRRLPLDATSQPPLNHPPPQPVAQPRRIAPAENNGLPKPVDWPLPPTLPTDSCRQLLAAGT